MFSKYAFIFVSLLIASQSAFAGGASSSSDRLCRREFAHDLVKCVVTSFFQRPKVRGEKLKTCVVAAKEERISCLGGDSGSNACADACQATYTSDEATCQSSYDPSICNGNSTCEALYEQERANCISQAVDVLNACNQSCP